MAKKASSKEAKTTKVDDGKDLKGMAVAYAAEVQALREKDPQHVLDIPGVRIVLEAIGEQAVFNHFPRRI